jgi:hypothetical protein
VNVNVHFSPIGRSARDGVQLYVAQPSLGGTRPPLVLGYAGSIDCSDGATATGHCASGVDNPATITSLAVGEWSATGDAYSFIKGCYSVVAAPDAKTAFVELASPASYPGAIASTTYSGTGFSTAKSGAC